MREEYPKKHGGFTRVDTGGHGLAIEHAGTLYILGERPLLLGRSSEADIVVDHPSVSRRHARVARGKDGYLIEDLESRNGVRVDARPVRGSAPIVPGVVVTLGDVSVVVRTAPGTPAIDSLPHTDLALDEHASGDDDTSPVDGLLLFMTEVDDALREGETRDAERTFARCLARPAELAAQRGRLEPGVAQTVALLSLRVGEATASSAWFDFVLRLYLATGSVVPLTVVNAMHALARTLGGVDRSALRQYAASVAERAVELTREERDVLDRLTALAGSSFPDAPPHSTD